jgi:hypothetical protein
MIMYRRDLSRGFSSSYDIHMDVGTEKLLDNPGRPIYECIESARCE